jgi:hypothetical protein
MQQVESGVDKASEGVPPEDGVEDDGGPATPPGRLQTTTFAGPLSFTEILTGHPGPDVVVPRQGKDGS